uniref:Citrate-binding protein n=1 Tax=Hevea brasiliensis TaxID=3981 RepID=CBPR_HEVBR|nr:RecName: Full=Citrate-binding protein; Flags: Precursor [Hevea brasiliensis]CAA61951.1 citrate binding protein [Hevea brasiliensis]
MKMKRSPYCFCCSFALLLLVSFLKDRHFCSADPTDGFTEVPLTEDNFVIQKPYDKPLNDRYSYKNGIRRLWVYENDKPFKVGSPTRPRTEIRIKGHDYSSGVWQFEGQVHVPEGTSGVTVMQVFGAVNKATALQLRVYNGDLKSYKSNSVATDIYNKWLRVNVIHKVGKGEITVFINGQQKLVVNDDGPAEHYFKCGVYAAPDGSSNYMESRWKNIKLYKSDNKLEGCNNNHGTWLVQ